MYNRCTYTKALYLIFENKKLLIFDLDGTLINSAPDLALAVNYMLKKIGKNTYSETLIHEWVGNGALTLVRRALSGSKEVDDSLDVDFVDKALEIFLDFYAKNLCNATVTYENVPQTLQSIKDKGYTLAIVTNKPFAFVAPILEGLKLGGLFALILGGDSLKEKKPHPLPLLHVCEILGFSVEESVMIGDSKNDILAANACKMSSVGVTYGYNYGEDINNYKPSIVISDFGDLLKSL